MRGWQTWYWLSTTYSGKFRGFHLYSYSFVLLSVMVPDSLSLSCLVADSSRNGLIHLSSEFSHVGVAPRNRIKVQFKHIFVRLKSKSPDFAGLLFYTLCREIERYTLSRILLLGKKRLLYRIIRKISSV